MTIFDDTLTEAVGLTDTIEGLNWTQWLAENELFTVVRYYLTLTGDAESSPVADLTLPMSSFTLRTNKDTDNDSVFKSLIAYVPSIQYAAQIAARPNGDLILTMTYEIDGVIEQTVELVRVDFDSVSSFSGPSSKSTSLSGSRTTTASVQEAVLVNTTFSSTVAGVVRYRFALPDFFMRSGDLVTVDGGSSFTVGEVVYTVSVVAQTMEIVEGERTPTVEERDLTEAIDLTDGIIVEMIVEKTLTEAIDLTDAVAVEAIFVKAITEAVVLGDSNAADHLVVSLAEAVALNDSNATDHLVTVLTEAVVLNDTVVAKNQDRKLIEAVVLDDSNVADHLVGALTEAIVLTDVVTEDHLVGALTEGIDVDDTIAGELTVTFVTAKSVIFDIAGSYNGPSSGTFVGIRQIDFYLGISKESLPGTGYTAYSTSIVNGDFVPANVFNTSLDKTSEATSNSWASANDPNDEDQRVIIVFDSPTEIDGIRINNYHHFGGFISRGAKGVEIWYSTDEITSTVYQEAISNSTRIFNNDFGQHAAADGEDEENLVLTLGGV
ncbi:hypothetical protein LCGC14_0721530 [marine sediment metagenome]|uniref:Uncharacterized protein n=1 Tax=marine sediment metagenome TaxID=412755 RepID=A0A0F9QCA4_9ZZZZ